MGPLDRNPSRVPTLGIALVAIPLAFAAGALALRMLLAATPHAFGEDLRQPLVVVDGWRGFGTGLFVVFAASILAAALAAWVAVRELYHSTNVRQRFGLAAIVAAAAIATAAALSWPVTFSSDVYAYAAYGDQLAGGIDPYLHTLVAKDALERATVWQWEGPPPRCVYGPLFLGLAAMVARLTASHGTQVTLFCLRLLSALAFLACIPLFFTMLPAGNRPRRLAATACFALNPVAIWSVAEGHNDAMMLALALAGAALVRFGRPVGGGVAVGLAALVKLSGLAVGLAAAALAIVDRSRSTSRRVVAGAALAVAVAAVGSLPVARGLLSGIGTGGHYLPQLSLQALGIGVFVLAGVPAALSAPLGATLALLGCTAAALVGIIRLRSDAYDGAAWLALAAWLAIPNPYPWYTLWILPVAAAAFDRPIGAALLGATILSVVRYLPDASSPLSPDARLVLTLVALAPLLWPLAAPTFAPARRKVGLVS